MNKFLILISSLIILSCSKLPEGKTNCEKKYSSGQEEIRGESLKNYHVAQMSFHRRDYLKAIEKFEVFINQNKDKKEIDEVFWSIEQISRVYLMVLKKPEKAISFLENKLKNVNLTSARKSIVKDWITTIKESTKDKEKHKGMKRGQFAFKMAKQYHKQGIEKNNKNGQGAGSIDLSIAGSYMLPLIYGTHDPKIVADSIYILGDIRANTWNDYNYWSDNHLLKEVIRRYPHTKISRLAHLSLEKEIKKIYYAQGEKIPYSLQMMLDNTKKQTLKK